MGVIDLPMYNSLLLSVATEWVVGVSAMQVYVDDLRMCSHVFRCHCVCRPLTMRCSPTEDYVRVAERLNTYVRITQFRVAATRHPHAPQKMKNKEFDCCM